MLEVLKGKIEQATAQEVSGMCRRIEFLGRVVREGLNEKGDIWIKT